MKKKIILTYLFEHYLVRILEDIFDSFHLLGLKSLLQDKERRPNSISYLFLLVEHSTNKKLMEAVYNLKQMVLDAVIKCYTVRELTISHICKQ